MSVNSESQAGEITGRYGKCPCKPYLVGLGDFSCGCLLARIALRHVSQELVDLVLSQWGYTSTSGKDEVAGATGITLAEAGRRVRQIAP